MSLDSHVIAALARERLNVHTEVFEAGRKEGYRQGFSEGVAQAKKIMEATFGQLLKDKS